MQAEKLVRMANQIATFFKVQGNDAPTDIADHLAKFWDPRMRRAILAHAAAGGEGLDPVALEAVRRLTPPAA
ncbi:formate dehydrogenase subunit delta [Zavarzinia aquatilis]|uniref:Formate dehydrogenase n=1 Tax=Zavarzinia aquatilis TaxID=2211142 RepID=A0A317EF39_9PROT|nr:formate dehydrogenase subunit delta [Zavarzinia aquatilis]PWR25371.1 formate dehydrogenase [Zavarzinia aquatilis]